MQKRTVAAAATGTIGRYVGIRRYTPSKGSLERTMRYVDSALEKKNNEKRNLPSQLAICFLCKYNTNVDWLEQSATREGTKHKTKRLFPPTYLRPNEKNNQWGEVSLYQTLFLAVFYLLLV